MHYSSWGLRATALESGVVACGFVLLLIAVVVAALACLRVRARRTRRAEAVDGRRSVPARCAAQYSHDTQGEALRSESSELQAEVAEGEAIAAIAACVACMASEPPRGGVRLAGLSAHLVAAIAAAIVSHEQADAGSQAGPVRIIIQKGALG